MSVKELYGNNDNYKFDRYSFLSPRSGQVRSECYVHVQSKLSGTGKKGGKGVSGGLPALAATREYKQCDWNR